MKHALVCAAGALSIIGTISASHAQPFPNKPVRFIVGFTAGSEVDVIGRMIAHEMGEKWSQRVVVDNRPGAGSTVAGAIVASATPDGYTLFFNSCRTPRHPRSTRTHRSTRCAISPAFHKPPA